MKANGSSKVDGPCESGRPLGEVNGHLTKVNGVSRKSHVKNSGSGMKLIGYKKHKTSCPKSKQAFKEKTFKPTKIKKTELIELLNLLKLLDLKTCSNSNIFKICLI